MKNLKKFDALNEEDAAKTHAWDDNQVITVVVDAVMTAMGGEWVPQQDKKFKDYLKSQGLFAAFKKVYGTR